MLMVHVTEVFTQEPTSGASYFAGYTYASWRGVACVYLNLKT